MADININVTATELDPTKKYIVEVRRGDLTFEGVDQLRKVLYDQYGVDGLIVVSETGKAINVKQIPEEGK